MADGDACRSERTDSIGTAPLLLSSPDLLRNDLRRLPKRLRVVRLISRLGAVAPYRSRIPLAVYPPSGPHQLTRQLSRCKIVACWKCCPASPENKPVVRVFYGSLTWSRRGHSLEDALIIAGGFQSNNPEWQIPELE